MSLTKRRGRELASVAADLVTEMDSLSSKLCTAKLPELSDAIDKAIVLVEHVQSNLFNGVTP